MKPPAGWKVARPKGKTPRLSREFKLPTFLKALAFVNRVGTLAERANHHPDIYISYNKVRLELWSHDANDITQRDYALAAKINQVTKAR